MKKLPISLLLKPEPLLHRKRSGNSYFLAIATIETIINHLYGAISNTLEHTI